MDLTSNVVKVTPPTVGFHTVLLSVCDQTSCTSEKSLEVMALPDLVVESIDFGTDDITQGDLITMRVLVRNQGQVTPPWCSLPNRPAAYRRSNHCHHPARRTAIRPLRLASAGGCKGVRFSAVVDRGLEIPEGDETNNAMEELVAINERADATNDGAEGGVAAGAVSIGIVVIALGLWD